MKSTCLRLAPLAHRCTAPDAKQWWDAPKRRKRGMRAPAREIVDELVNSHLNSMPGVPAGVETPEYR